MIRPGVVSGERAAEDGWLRGGFEWGRRVVDRARVSCRGVWARWRRGWLGCSDQNEVVGDRRLLRAAPCISVWFISVAADSAEAWPPAASGKGDGLTTPAHGRVLAVNTRRGFWT